MIEDICLKNITIDCKNAVKLRDFYAFLLNWESEIIHGFPVLYSPSGLILLFNEADFEYISPIWPEEVGKQQKQMHFDFQVTDVKSAVLKAEKLGAKKAQKQYGEPDYVTMLDLEGHPFCLCIKK